MPKRFLNIEYLGTRTAINVTDCENLSEVQDAVKMKLANTLALVDAPQLQLYHQGQRIKTWADFNSLPPKCFDEAGSHVVFQVVTTKLSLQFDNFSVTHPSAIPESLLSPLKALNSLLSF